MRYFRRTAAFAASLLICLGCISSPAIQVFADEEDTGSVTAEAEPEEDDGDPEVIMSGDFQYTVDSDGNAHLVKCTDGKTELVVPDTIDGVTVTEIESAAFTDSVYEKITIPASIEYISAENPFAPCEHLAEIVVEEGNQNYCIRDGVLFTKDMKKLICYPQRLEAKSYTVPEGVETLGIASLFQTLLTEIKLPSTLQTVERHALSYNKNLTSIDLSGTQVTELGIMALVECSWLTEVKLPEKLRKIGLAAFMSCTRLETIELPDGLSDIGQASFQGTAIKKVRIPDSVQSIGYCAFGYDENERADKNFVIIGAKGSAAEVYSRDSDSEYEYSNSFIFMTTAEADRREKLEAMGVRSEGDYEYAISDDGAILVSCYASSSTASVPSQFEGRDVVEIYTGAFMGCTSQTIVLPETVKIIGEEAFPTTLKSLTIPGGCEVIDGEEPFIFCTSLEEIIVTEGDGEFSSQDGVLYSKDKSLLIAYPAMKPGDSFTAPDTVKDISTSAFSYNQLIKKLDLSSVESIGNYVFEGCEGIESVKFSKELKVVGMNAFMGCRNLKSVHLYDKLETIGDYAFGYDYDAALAAEIQQNGGSGYAYSVMDDFTIYTDEDTLAYEYAQACGIKVVTGTTTVGGKELSKTFVGVFGAIGGAVVLGGAAIITGKAVSKKKKSSGTKKDEESGK